jgi:cell pole-organizing protein PopZ
MANPSAAHEPSMEEILASIRQIISEDGEGSPAPRIEARTAPQPQPQPQSQPPPAAREERHPPASEPAGARPSIGPAEGEFRMPLASENTARMGPPSSGGGSIVEAPRRGAYPPMAGPERQAPNRAGRDSDDRHLLSGDSDTAVSGAFSALAHTILAQNARTLEDLVAEMLQPMLKDWLDDNLPSLVERIVQEEIQRVSRGRR